MEAPSAVKLLVVSLLVGFAGTALAETRPLGKFLRHYEPLDYDAESLMYHHHRVRRSIIGPREINLQLSVFDREFDLQLVPETDFFHKDFQLHVNGKPYNNHQLKSYLYKGFDQYDPTVKARGHLVNGVFDGSISTGDETYHIEPAERYIDEPTDFHSIVYRRSDINLPSSQRSQCGATSEVLKRMTKLQTSATTDGESESHQRLHNRQVRNSAKVRCWLHVLGDFEFYQAVTDAGAPTATRIQQAAALLTIFIRDASEIYQETDFDQDGTVDNIQFGIMNMDIIESVQPTGFYANPFIGVEAFLTDHSANDWGEYCLAYRFTYRDFDGGVLGLAYVAPQPGSNARGGICEDFSFGSTLNTGIVTLLNYGARVPTGVTTITFAHEAGHNFGSQHDPAECSSSGNGRYIMYAFANDLSDPNNDQFSSCSIEMMDNVIAERGQSVGATEEDSGCFREAADLCGNGIVDENEECDCLNVTNGICMSDPCCNGSSCNISTEIACSPDQGPCCNASCAFITGDVCSQDTECAFSQTCDGFSYECPDPDPKPIPMNSTFIECNGGTNLCVGAECNGSICVAIDAEECECPSLDEACHICCNVSGTCLSSIRIAEENINNLTDSLPGGMGQTKMVGFPCASFTGYCDFLRACMPVDSEGALDRLANLLFDSDTLDTALEWVEDMWWAVVLIVVGVLVALFFIVLIVHLLLPRAQPEHMRKRAQRRRSIRRSRKDLRGKGVELRGY